jgi:uncharacterized repeat protein (TIGR01451 family)
MALAFVLAGVMSTITAMPAEALVSNVILASINQAGVKGDLDSVSPRLSGNGNRVMFSTRSTTLDPRDTDAFNDVYVKDLTTGQLFLVSTSDAGVKGNQDSFVGGLSTDGTKALFISNANNLDPVDDGTATDVYVKDLTTGDVVLVSTTDTGGRANNSSGIGYISGDGRFVAFNSNATNFDPADTDTFSDIYVKDLVTGDVTLVSTNDAGVKIFGGVAGFSADGNVVLFGSTAANVDPLDTDDHPDAFTKNLATGEVTLVSIASDGTTKGNIQSVPTGISADGSIVSFDSYSTNLDPRDTDIFPDVYVKDLESGVLTLASVGEAGKASTGAGDSSLSADGTQVAFDSGSDNLMAEDPRLDGDTYVKDLETGELLLASTSDLGVKGNDDSGTPSLSGDGSRVAFTSLATRFDPADRRPGQQDIYVKELTPSPPEADLSITNETRHYVVIAGGNITYTLTVANAGPLPATGITVTDQLPASVTFVSATGTGAVCAESAGVVTCSLTSTLAPGSRGTRLSVVVGTSVSGWIITTATVAASEPDLHLENNTARRYTYSCSPYVFPQCLTD